MKKRIVFAVSMLALALSTSTSAFALIDLRETTREATKEVTRTVESTVNGTTKTVRDTVDATKDTAKEQRGESQKERIEQRRSELTEKLEAKTEERKEMLEGRRLAMCQNRQVRINKLLDSSSAVGSRHLENLQKLEAKVVAFADKNGITSQSYQDAKAGADQKEAAAVAALQVMDAKEFECGDVDAADPSNMVVQLRDAKRSALSEYRDAIVSLIHVVKDEFKAANQPSEARE